MQTRLLLGTLSLALLAGCAAQTSNVRVDMAESGLPNCQSFAWNPLGSDAASLTDQRVRDQVMQTLRAKGYTESADKPDCRIAYHMTKRQVPPPKPKVGVGVGGGSRGVGGGLGISLPIGKSKAMSGTFTLDVIDAAKNAQVWSGSLDASFKAAELDEAEAKAVVEKVLARYPDRVAQ